MRVADMVLDELLRIIGHLEAQVCYWLLSCSRRCRLIHFSINALNKDLQRFKVLRSRVLEVANNSLRKCLKPTNKMIESIIECELAYINTSHPDFIGTQHLMGTNLDSLKETSAPATPLEDRKTRKYDEDTSVSSGGGFFSSLFGGEGKKSPTTSRPKPGMICCFSL
jgi:hypothetical protein